MTVVQTSERTGRCACGAVHFFARNVPDHYTVCHCVTCRRWLGSVLLGVSMPKDGVDWTGIENVREISLTSWATRGFCTICGSGIYFQFTGDEPYADDVEIPLGVFDDPNGFSLRTEIYVDQQPDSFALRGEGHTRLTRADCIKKLPILGSTP